MPNTRCSPALTPQDTCKTKRQRPLSRNKSGVVVSLGEGDQCLIDEAIASVRMMAAFELRAAPTAVANQKHLKGEDDAQLRQKVAPDGFSLTVKPIMPFITHLKTFRVGGEYETSAGPPTPSQLLQNARLFSLIEAGSLRKMIPTS